MITKETVQDFFKDLKEKGNFDASKKLTWGYFFLGSDIDDLRKVANLLEKQNYTFIDIFDADKINPNDVQEYYLHMQKDEHHDIQSLLKRNDELYSVANLYKIIYDGFDVGNLE